MSKYRQLKNNRRIYPVVSYNLYYPKQVVVFQCVQLLKIPRKVGVFDVVSEDFDIPESELDQLIEIINEVNDRIRQKDGDFIFSLNL